MTTYNASRKKYYEKTKDKYREINNKKQREYRNIPSVKINNSNQAKIRHKNNPIASMFRNAKARSVKKGLEFSIIKEDIIIPMFCPYLGIALYVGSYSDRKDGRSPTIDRMDSNKGYTKDNIEVISDLANRMKQNASIETLIKFSKSVICRFDK